VPDYFDSPRTRPYEAQLQGTHHHGNIADDAGLS
jgi:hypothetical protein